MSLPRTVALDPTVPLTLPTFTLDFAMDDPVDQAAVINSDPDGADPTTHWLAGAVAVAVGLAEGP